MFTQLPVGKTSNDSDGQTSIEPDARVVRNSIFMPNGIALREFTALRKRGRPRAIWSKTVLSLCVRAAGSYECLKQHWSRVHSSLHKWRSIVNNSMV